MVIHEEMNIGNSVFNGFNDIGGLMICGYEWGFSTTDQETLQGSEHLKNNVQHVFSNKAAEYGAVANSWHYDRRIIDWFEIWGHPLQRNGHGGDFEKCLLQTNWCDDCNNHIIGSYSKKLLADDQIKNFIKHIDTYRPKLILFMGSQIIKLLQHDNVLPEFKKIMGEIRIPLVNEPTKKPFDGRAFKVGFQSFDQCDIVCLPHPSGSHGLTNDYIKLFSDEIGHLIHNFKSFKGVS